MGETGRGGRESEEMLLFSVREPRFSRRTHGTAVLQLLLAYLQLAAMCWSSRTASLSEGGVEEWDN
jgi:hypothetical protein